MHRGRALRTELLEPPDGLRLLVRQLDLHLQGAGGVGRERRRVLGGVETALSRGPFSSGLEVRNTRWLGSSLAAWLAVELRRTCSPPAAVGGSPPGGPPEGSCSMVSISWKACGSRRRRGGLILVSFAWTRSLGLVSTCDQGELGVFR